MVMPKGYKKDMKKREGGLTDEWYESKLSDGRVRLLNRSRRRDSEAKRRKANRLKSIEYLGGSCVDCGAIASEECDRPINLGGLALLPIECFDIDHVLWEKKKHNFCSIMKRNFDKWVKPEIDNCKCELVCKNCHVIRTVKTKRTDEKMKIKMRESSKKSWKNQHTSAPQPLNSTSA